MLNSRLQTLTALSLIPEGEAAAQFDLLGDNDQSQRDKLERLECAMDSIRARFGKEAISPASTPPNSRRQRHAPPPGGHYEVE